ncbi:MAG: sodium:proton antiporter, partial [Pseudomonadota bacterium]
MDPVAVSTFHLWLTFAVILAAIIAYALDRWAIEIVSGAILAFLVLAFEFHPLPPLAAQGTNPGSPGLRGIELLEGFANPALISILCLLIIGRGLNQTGALELPTRQVMAIGLSHPRRLLASMFILAGAISAVMNNTPVVVMFIPIIAGIAAKLKRAPSQVMMPLSYLCVLGGMTTVIGSSTNLIAVEAAFERTGEEIGFFAFTEFGLILASVGALYTLFVAPRLLPYKESLGDDAPLSGKHYLAEVTVHPGHPL